MRSGLPSPLKSATPCTFLDGSMPAMNASAIRTGPFLDQAAVLPWAGLLQPRAGLLSWVKSGNARSKRAKVAVTDFAASIVTTQLADPVQAPLQPLNFEPVAGAAASVTTVPLTYGSEQSAPQLMPPAGVVEVTVPTPGPVLFT